jgi:hypothetical protein
MNSLSCFVLMPFSGHRSFVYHLAIKRAIDELNATVWSQQGLSLEVQVVRADEVPSHHDDKVSQIRKLIQFSDILIIDISDFNPNVLWELDFSTALHKHIMVISEKWEVLPFNLRVSDICDYTFSYEGLAELQRKITLRLTSLVQLALRERESLIRHPEFEDASRQVMATLRRIKDESLLKRLALNELTRIGTRFEKLGRGLFELRNEKPYDEVIRYYCDYVSQLKGDDSRFDVVSNLNFWKEITDGGEDFRYIHANFNAARSGAQVRRVILVDANEFEGRTVKHHKLYSDVLEDFYKNHLEIGDNLKTKLLFSKNFNADRRAYSNFGILTKGAETLVFNPMYEGLRMTETTFTYFNSDERRLGLKHSHLQTIEKYEARFTEAWNKGEELSERHFS